MNHAALKLGSGIVVCLALFPAFLQVFFAFAYSEALPFGLPRVASFSDLSIQFFDLAEGAEASIQRPNPPVSFSLLIFIGCLTLVFRKSVAFVFFLFHLALAGVCVFLDSVFFSPLPDKFVLIERAAAFSFFIVLFSQIAFLAFHMPSFQGFILLVLSIAVSSAAFVIGCLVLGTLAQDVDGTLLVFLTYLILSYGVFGLHVASLTLLMHVPEPRTLPEASG